jgi:vitamin K-dependent gamma-carboxylase
MMAQDRDLVPDLARHVAADFRGHVREVAVYADAFVSLNGRPAQRIIDPRVGLGGAAGAPWILPR